MGSSNIITAIFILISVKTVDKIIEKLAAAKFFDYDLSTVLHEISLKSAVPQRGFRKGMVFNMDEIGFNNRHLTYNGRPWFPIMGEIHYTRVPQACWRETLYKMKTGGVTVVSSYVIWIHHEEVEGQYDFSGDRNLRGFIETCRECGLQMLLRIGPWCHGEVRNGGFPDWLLKKSFIPRTNDEDYFTEVSRFYRSILGQVRGLLFKDGGPIIGVQIENEYGHAGGLTGEDGEEHMRRLTAMARQAGFDVPLYTSTGWGGAVTGGLLPVMGGYCDAPWDSRLTELEPSGNYIFTHERNDHNIGSDLGLGAGLTFEPEHFPYLTAELGGGLQVTKHRRPVATAADIGAMTVAKLGSGVNLLGYYMYCGGVNPEGKLTTLQESRETGYPNDLPVYSYDFRAPIGAFGQISETYKELKLYSMFARDFGEELCGMPAIIPRENPLMPDNTENLRHSFRHNGTWGYLYFNNYVRRRELPPHTGITLTVPCLDRKLPVLNFAGGDYGFYPFDMPAAGGVIRFAAATPLCRINETIILYGKPGAPISIEGAPDILLISRRNALNAYKIHMTQDYLLICDYPVIENGSGWSIQADGDVTLKTYPALPSVPEGFAVTGSEGAFTLYRRELEPDAAYVNVKPLGGGRFELLFNRMAYARDYYLKLRYAGESARLYMDGRLIIDDFYADGTWDIGLSRYGFPSSLFLEISALEKDHPVYLEEWPGTPARALLGAELTCQKSLKLF